MRNMSFSYVFIIEEKHDRVKQNALTVTQVCFKNTKTKALFLPVCWVSWDSPICCVHLFQAKFLDYTLK
jgi:hypothetical protein